MRSARQLPRRTRVFHILGLGVSVAALAGMVQLQSVWASADARSDEVEAEVEMEAEMEAAAAPPTAPKVLAVAPTPATIEAVIALVPSLTAVVTQPDAAAPAIDEPEPPTHAVMPNLKGKSLRSARKALKAAGLKMSVRDNYNDRIDREDWGMFKVRSQKVEAGTDVELGKRVRVKARMRGGFAKGY